MIFPIYIYGKIKVMFQTTNHFWMRNPAFFFWGRPSRVSVSAGAGLDLGSCPTRNGKKRELDLHLNMLKTGMFDALLEDETVVRVRFTKQTQKKLR
jgi:hypothetical protein